MKVNIIINGHALSGYTNIDPHGFGDDSKVLGDVSNIDEHVENSEAREILAHDVINFLPYEQIDSVISDWVKKLRHGGKIVILGKDLWHLCKAYSQKLVSTEQFNSALFGEQSHSGDYRLSHITMPELAMKLEALGLKVVKKRVNGYEMVVEAIRP